MAKFEFKEDVQVKRYLTKVKPRRRAEIASKVALLVLSNIELLEADQFEPASLFAFWATLCAVERSRSGSKGIQSKRASEASRSYATSIFKALSNPQATAAPYAAGYAAGHAALAHSSASHAGQSFRFAADSQMFAKVTSGKGRADQSKEQTTQNDPPSNRLLNLLKKIEKSPNISIGQLCKQNIDLNPIFHGKFTERLASNKKWAFFHDWYLGMWEGTWTDWDLAREVAKIKPEVWEEGLSFVAAEVEGIKERLGRYLPRPDNVPELERKKLTEHVRKLLDTPKMTALAAEGAAETLKRAIEQYLQESKENCLPDELAHLDDMPSLFSAIAATAKRADLGGERAGMLADEIEALNAKVADLEAKLKEARSKTVNGLFTQSAIKAAGTAFGAGLVGSLGLAISHFFGQWPGDLTLENLRGWLSDLAQATPRADDLGSLPPATDV